MIIRFDISAVGEEYKPEIELIKKAVERKKVVFFSKPWQTDTKLVKYYLDQLNEKYYEIAVDTLDNEVELHRVFYSCTGGHKLWPYIFIRGKYIGNRYELMELNRTGVLKDILKEPYDKLNNTLQSST